MKPIFIIAGTIFIAFAGWYFFADRAPVLETVDFIQEGNLVRDNPGMAPGVWHFLYEEPGKAALAVPLAFDAESECLGSASSTRCDTDAYERGDRALIEGTRRGDAVVVRRLAEVQSYACNGDGKVCPDGSVVGRQGPKCEFTACPSATATSTTIRTSLGQRRSGLNVTLTPLEVKEDSRCPVDVQCVWEGTVKVRTKIESGLGTSDMVLELGKPITTEVETVTLTDVAPVRRAGVAIPLSSYQFVFVVAKREIAQ